MVPWVVADRITIEPELHTPGSESPAGSPGAVAEGLGEASRPAPDGSPLNFFSSKPFSENVAGWAVLTIGAAFFLGIVLQWYPLNGSLALIYWLRPWRNDMGVLRTALFLLLPFLAILHVVHQAEIRPGARLWPQLGILALSNFLLQMLGVLADPLGFGSHPPRIGLIGDVVLSQSTTSYFNDALRIRQASALLRNFDRLVLHLHSATHPPGPILFFYLFAKFLGAHAGAIASGIAVGALATLGVWATYAFAGLWTTDRRTRILAGALYALLPALTLYFPELNQIYPIFSMLLILLWHKSLEAPQAFPKEAFYLGLCLAVSLFFSYTLATIGLFLAGYGLYWLRENRSGRAALGKLLWNGTAAIGFCVLLFAALHWTTGYRPIASFRNAQAWQVYFQGLLHRSHAPLYALYDSYEFLLGAGVLVGPLVLFHLAREWRNPEGAQPGLALTLIGLGTVLVIDLSGQMRGETSRVWLFLMPLLVVPAALELARFGRRWLWTLFALQWLILVALKAKIYFHVP